MSGVGTRMSKAAGYLGFSTSQFFSALRGAPRFIRHYLAFKRAYRAVQDPSARCGSVLPLHPCFVDWYMESGAAKGDYFHQDLLVAQRVYELNPETLGDVGSRVDGYVSHVASFRPIDVFDIRPLVSKTKNIRFRQLDLMKPPSELANHYHMLTCLHSLEHFGLGRYGDDLDPEGHVRGLRNLGTMVRPGGTLIISCPIGSPRVLFNANRVLDPEWPLTVLDGALWSLERFAFVDGDGDLNTPNRSFDLGSLRSLPYACGIYEFRKADA